MSTTTDFSQFLRTKNGEQETETVSEFSQFMRKPKEEERGVFETFVERPGQIAGQAIVAGARALPRTGFDLLKTVVEATGGDISKLEAAQEAAPEGLKAFARSLFPTFEEVREEQLEGRTFGDKKPLAQPETALERGIEKFGRFVGEAPAFGGVGGAKGLASLGGLAAGVQVAEESDLGPIGQLVAGGVGALAPSAIGAGIKGVTRAAVAPKKTTAEAVAKVFTPKKKLALQKQIIQDAKESGVQLDIGSITDSKILKGIQAKLTQSSLTGPALDNLRKELSDQVIKGYKDIADNLGRSQFETVHEAGEVLQNSIKAERDFSRQQIRDIYSGAKGQLTDKSVVFPDRVISLIEKLEGEIKPGSLKGTEQKAVIEFINDLKKDVMTESGQLKGAKVKDLINDKIAINDIVDFEIEGGAKQVLKQLAKEIGDTIQQYGRQDLKFAKDYKLADKKFGEHARTFRNKNIAASLKTQDPRQLLSKMNTTQGIRDIKKALQGSAEGRELFKDISRFKLDQVFEKNLEKGIGNQIKFGQFSNVLKKANNKEIVREILGKDSLNRLEKLMKTSGTLSESANKFLNTSQSAVSGTDMVFIGKLLGDMSALFSGNPFPIARSGSILASAKQISKLISDPEFLKMVEEAVLASKSNSPAFMERSATNLAEASRKALRAAGEATDQEEE